MKPKKKRWLIAIVFLAAVLLTGTAIILLMKFLPRTTDVVVPANAQQNGFNNYHYCGEVAYVDGALYYVDNRPLIGGIRKVENGADSYLCEGSGRLYGWKNHLYILEDSANGFSFDLFLLNTDDSRRTLLAKNISRFQIGEDDIHYAAIETNERNAEVENVYRVPLIGGQAEKVRMWPNELPLYGFEIPSEVYDYDIPRMIEEYLSGGQWKKSIFEYNTIDEKEYVSSRQMIVGKPAPNRLAPNQNPEYIGMWKLNKQTKSGERVNQKLVGRFALFDTEHAYYVQNGRLHTTSLTE